jgi:hypothetical protein
MVDYLPFPEGKKYDIIKITNPYIREFYQHCEWDALLINTMKKSSGYLGLSITF